MPEWKRYKIGIIREKSENCHFVACYGNAIGEAVLDMTINYIRKKELRSEDVRIVEPHLNC